MREDEEANLAWPCNLLPTLDRRFIVGFSHLNRYRKAHLCTTEGNLLQWNGAQYLSPIIALHALGALGRSKASSLWASRSLASAWPGLVPIQINNYTASLDDRSFQRLFG